MPKLMIQEGGQQSVLELFDDETTIGRGAANVVQVADGHASKHHAVIRRVGGRVKLVDLESKNGTRVNGEFKNQRWLTHGDVVAIGAMTMTFDGSDVAAAPAPAPVAYAAAPLVSGPAVAAPAPAAAPVADRPRRARTRDRDDDDRDERPRGVARRSNNNTAVAMMVGIGVIGVIAILILLISSGGAGKNALALRSAKQLYARDGVEAALAYLQANSDPSDEDGYVSVAAQLREWQSMVANKGADAKVDEAKLVMKKLIRDRIEQHMNGLTDEALGRRALQFLEDYKGTATAMELENSPYGDYPKLRALMEKAKAAPK